ncbi:ABC transporter substrate-binding protein [Haloterrigena salifodinae]|uniref:ABC transporter substrate-binding protein n=1 Tax=Haloterrigena salifodinae TaxID=2675099 RepID=UPI002010D7AA|nr:ABC transporter substrate-binding protein [Haloterrigena salifodinae]
MQSDQLQRYFIDKEEFESYAVTIEEFEGNTAVLKVRDELTWHNGDPGDPVNADDLYTKLVTDAIIGDTISTLWTDIQRDGDKSVKLTLEGTVNERLFKDGLNYYWLETPHRLYKEYVERWEDATTDDEIADIRSDLRNDSFDESKVKGNGPFQFEERDNRHLKMSLYEHHPDADNINWENWELHKVSTDTASVLLGGEVDGIRNYSAPETVFEQAPDDLLNAQLPALWGHSLPFNHEDDDFSNIRVRQAVSEFIDRQACADNYGRLGQPVEAPSGLVGNIDGQNEPSSRWENKVSDEMVEQLHRYDDPERGRELLRGEGYQKDDGTWYRPNGDPFEMTIKVPAGLTDWHPVYETIVDNLENEGIGTEMQRIEESTYWADHYTAGDYKVASTGWTLQRSSPYYVFDMYYNIDTEFMNLDPENLEAPPIGEPDGELQSVDPRGLMDELLVAQDEEEATDITDRLAWITNQTVPMLQLDEINDPVWFYTDDWEVPDPDSSKYQSKWPLWWFPRNGELQAK